MKTSLQNINALPMRTWRWLGVNDTVIEAEVPAIAPLANLPNPTLPTGIAPLASLPAQFNTIATGMGAAAKNFVLEHKNAGAALHAAAQNGSDTPIIYAYNLNANTPAVVDNTEILAEENSQIVVVQIVTSTDDAPVFHAGLTRIVAKAGASVKVVQLQMLNNDATHFNNVGVWADERANVELVQIELGSKRALAGCHSVLAGYKAHMDISTAYFGSGQRSQDFNYVTQHIAPATTSEMQAAGALFDDSEKIYRGTIDFVKGAARAVGHEQENVLLFSKNARCRSVPLILCGEENVEGQHAATIGKVDEAKMFYLNSRGLNEEEAKRIMVEAQFAPLLAKVPLEDLREEIAAYLAERMQAL
ncbi:SufD family Fe-S cluster assembly protein [Ruminococcaceae bacterium OttesenSCG-928-A16]|nr:SufD family Fe-S cluster assembly protein [Ruminococcaceae bacterium OttesenSCG-928-A16]